MVDMVLEALFFVASCLVIVVCAVKMRETAYGKNRDKLRRPMNSLIFIDHGGPYRGELKIVDIGPPMDVAFGWRKDEDEDETQEPQQ